MQMIPVLSNLPAEQFTRKGAGEELTQGLPEDKAFQLLLQTNQENGEGDIHLDEKSLAKKIATLPLLEFLKEEEIDHQLPNIDEEKSMLNETETVLAPSIPTEFFAVGEERID